MRVKFHSVGRLDNQSFLMGEHQISDKHAHSSQLKKLVRDGKVSILPRTPHEQKIQAQKDEDAQAHAAHQAAKGAE